MQPQNIDPLLTEVIQQHQAAQVMSRTATRLGGLCTLLALVGWAWGGAFAAKEIRIKILMGNISMLMGQHFQIQQPNSARVKSDEASLSGGSNGVLDIEQARKLLSQRRQSDRTPYETVRRQIRMHQTTQTVVGVAWHLVMILAGGFLFCAGFAGLMGSERSRRWHRLAAWWMVLATGMTVGGVMILSRWGGFPAPDHQIMIWVGTIQISYALIIAMALFLTRPAGIDWLTKTS